MIMIYSMKSGLVQCERKGLSIRNHTQIKLFNVYIQESGARVCILAPKQFVQYKVIFKQCKDIDKNLTIFLTLYIQSQVQNTNPTQ